MSTPDQTRAPHPAPQTEEKESEQISHSAGSNPASGSLKARSSSMSVEPATTLSACAPKAPLVGSRNNESAECGTLIQQTEQPDAVAAGHNPDRLTNAQVETHLGWRLLNASEILPLDWDRSAIYAIEFWSRREEKWCVPGFGDMAQNTYRTRLSPADLAKARGVEKDQPSEPVSAGAKCPKKGDEK